MTNLEYSVKAHYLMHLIAIHKNEETNIAEFKKTVFEMERKGFKTAHLRQCGLRIDWRS